MQAPLLYEINTRCWLGDLTRRAGKLVTLANIPEAQFSEWRALGFTHIWLMGVWTGGPQGQTQALASPGLRQAYATALPGWTEKDVGPSPYAIAEYRVSPALGGDEGLGGFRTRLREHNLKLVLDFVPNHLGLDHPWIQDRAALLVQSLREVPETFMRTTRAGPRWFAHGRDPYFPSWSDTVQLDYRLNATRTAMTELLQRVAGLCDGVRCDMAMLLLSDIFARTWERFPIPVTNAETAAPGLEFWASAISSVKRARPDFLFLAEAYWGSGPRLQALGFDYTYDKDLYDKLVARDGPAVQRHLLGTGQAALTRSAYFLENHDEPRIASLLSPAEQRAAALVMLALPGLRLLHEGQLSGARLKLTVQLLRRFEEPEVPEVRRIYRDLLTVLRSSVVGNGAPSLIEPRRAWADNPTGQNIVLVVWQKEPDAFDFVVVNLAPHRSQCYAPLQQSNIPAHDWSFTDLLGGERFIRSGKDLHEKGLYLDLPPQAAQLFHCEPAAATQSPGKTPR